jgi:hypothetical protein
MAKKAVLGSHVFCMGRGRKQQRRSALEMEQQWRDNSGEFTELKTEESSCQVCKRTKFSGLKVNSCESCTGVANLMLLFPGNFPSNGLPRVF